MKKILVKFGSVIASLALLIGTTTTNSACFIFIHQPKEPEGMKKYKSFSIKNEEKSQ